MRSQRCVDCYGSVRVVILRWLASSNKLVQVAPPIILPVPTSSGQYKKGSGLAVYLNSLGEMTALNSHGEQEWQASVTCLISLQQMLKRNVICSFVNNSCAILRTTSAAACVAMSFMGETVSS